MTTEKRPMPTVTLSKWDRRADLLGYTGLAWMLVYLVLYWSHLPAQVPTHFGLSGEPDAWGSKWSLLALPILSLILFFGLTILRRFPQHHNYLVTITEENAQVQYANSISLLTWLKAEIVWTFLFLEWASIHTTKENMQNINLPIGIMMALIFATTFLFIIRMVKHK